MCVCVGGGGGLAVASFPGFPIFSTFPASEIKLRGAWGQAVVYVLSKIVSMQLMSERIDQFVLTPPSQKVTLAPLPPDYRPIPCKPLFFDLALNHIEFPSQGGQEGGGGGGGGNH